MWRLKLVSWELIEGIGQGEMGMVIENWELGFEKWGVENWVLRDWALELKVGNWVLRVENSDLSIGSGALRTGI